MIRRTLWTAGAPFRGLLVAAIHLYRVTLSGLLGGQCRFYPSCSHYAEDAIRTHGAVKGAGLATWRVLRCNPFGHGGVEHVPERSASGQYEDLIRRPLSPRKADA
jgi:putative membrane protein insertion efficiency factor